MNRVYSSSGGSVVLLAGVYVPLVNRRRSREQDDGEKYLPARPGQASTHVPLTHSRIRQLVGIFAWRGGAKRKPAAAGGGRAHACARGCTCRGDVTPPISTVRRQRKKAATHVTVSGRAVPA